MRPLLVVRPQEVLEYIEAPAVLAVGLEIALDLAVGVGPTTRTERVLDSMIGKIVLKKVISDRDHSTAATVITGTGAERTVFSATLPSRIRSVPRRPVVPIPTACTSFESTLSRMTSIGVPCST